MVEIKGDKEIEGLNFTLLSLSLSLSEYIKMTPEEQAEKIKQFRQELTDIKYPVTDEAG